VEGRIEHALVLGRRIQECRGGSGRPLLYLHSAAGEAIWLPFMTGLAESYDLYAPAHPGFLASEGIDEIRDIEDLVYHYLAYMDAKGWRSVDVVGLSLGGWIGAEIAARYPERVSRLVLVDSVGIWIPERPLADIFAIDGRHPERFAELLFHDLSHPFAQMLALPREARRALPDEAIVNFLNAMAATARVGWNPLLHDPRLESLLPRVTARTLCLWGDHDRVSPPEYGERFAKLIPGAQSRVVPECGHMLPIEKPEAFLAAVRGFVG
jgi:pimeloyl-ACP methyl ester carboxylesterase